MNWLRTPPKIRRVTWSICLTILAAPVVVAAHFFIRYMHGDYPSDGDSIAIPIFMFGILIFPIALILLVRGLHPYTPRVFLFTWPLRRFMASLFWMLLMVFPVGITSVGMIIDGIGGRLYWVSAFFLLHCYCLLVLRASIIADDPPVATA